MAGGSRSAAGLQFAHGSRRVLAIVPIPRAVGPRPSAPEQAAGPTRRTDLSTASLLEARLTGAPASERTRWPADFDPTAAGVVHTDDPGPEPSPLLQPPGKTWQAPPLRSTP
ncbi:hypothetical protein [Streptomyces sp. NPDC006147]|uniref:hypothetical protein n=1 Tax=Streptomyces sp. NPDC006147 TaxID=3155597 RepID=UPI0033A118B1